MVAIIEGEMGGVDIIKEGKAATADRVSDAFLLHRGIAPATISNDVWSRVPEALRDQIDSRVRAAEGTLSRQWRQYSNEEMMTGALFSPLGDSFREGAWEAKISFVEFSKQTKEPGTGTDVAVVVDALASDGRRSFKSMWFQAKSLESEPDRFTSPPRLAAQLEKAKRHCDASFGLVYTPVGIFVLREDADPIPFHTALDECMRCKIGDTGVAALRNSVNRRKLLQVLVTEQGQAYPPVRRLNLKGR
ncbi:hypothetical protein [Variovorax sp. LjRoot178]|uniref:hypothetical protein n=1 Tax=Variovorax sp. LjRoot178 TaxID=3342277 RepID=UPI003ED0D217